MEPFVRLKSAPGMLAPGVRLLKADDYLAWVKASEILEQVSRDAEAARLAAEEAYAESRKRGYEDGLAEARMEMATRMLGTVEKTVAYFGGIEHQVADLVMTALRKILGQIDEGELMQRVVRQALQVVQSQPRVTIRVCPAQADALQARIQQVTSGFTSLGVVTLSADPRLEPGGCILETDIGVVEASLDVQLAALDKFLRSRLQDRELLSSESSPAMGPSETTEP